MTHITFYGGVNEIGGNQIFLTDRDGATVVFDFGERPDAMKRYFPGLLNPRSAYGIKDLVELGLLPWIENFYRNDLLELADLPKTNSPSVSGIVVSHPHPDHYDNVAYVDHRVPIYCSRDTLRMIKTVEIVSHTTWRDEFSSFRERNPPPDITFVRKTKKGEEERIKLSELGPFTLSYPRKTEEGEVIKIPYIAYPQYNRLFNKPLRRKFITKQNKKKQQKFNIGGIRVESYPIDHCDGACAYIIHTPNTTIAYTGDIRRHGEHADKTDTFLAKAAKADIDVLMIEGTRIDDTEEKTEAQVEGEMEEIIRQYDSSHAIFVDLSYRDLERLSIVRRVGYKLGREVVLPPKNAAFWYYMRVGSLRSRKEEDSSLKFPKVYKTKKGYDNPLDYEIFERQVFKKFDVLSEEEILTNPGKYIVCVSYYQLPQLISFNPPRGSLFILSKPAPWDRESEAVETVINNWAGHFGLEVARIHTHHHAPQQDLVHIIRTIKPKMVIPIHTQHPELFGELIGDITEVRYVERGIPIEM